MYHKQKFSQLKVPNFLIKKTYKQNNKKGKNQTKTISDEIYRPDLMVNNSALPGSSTYKNNISLNFSKKK